MRGIADPTITILAPMWVCRVYLVEERLNALRKAPGHANSPISGMLRLRNPTIMS
jgi:hypothetical protein